MNDELNQLRKALERAIKMLEETHWNEHHPQCPAQDFSIGSDKCICVDQIQSLRAVLV